MSLIENFQFSQASLQDFVDCRRRFQLRYLQHVAWPAIESEPILENERFLQQGARFHRMIQQHLLGVPAERLSGLALDEDLERWWKNYLAFAPQLVDKIGSEVLYPEVALTALLGDHSLVAKCDLVVVEPEGQAIIYDWKTSRKRPKRRWLEGRLQTHVYPYLLVQAGGHLNSGEVVPPEKVEMVYWFADFPDQPERFPYSLDEYQADEKYLLGLVKTFDRLGEEDFPLTEDERACRYCVYRSLCERGVEAGAFGEEEDPVLEDGAETSEFDIDFDQIAEVEF
jgi:CRISPR/Cas system-associated exonuclease Cas4 (RecB family)